MSARHRLSKLLLRHGLVYCGGKAWTGAHGRWLGVARQTVFDRSGLRWAFDTAYDTVLATTARRDRLDTAIAEMAADSEFTPVVVRLGCLRGVSTLTAFGLAAEIGDWSRVDRPHDRRLPGAGAQRLLRDDPIPRGNHQDRQLDAAARQRATRTGSGSRSRRVRCGRRVVRDVARPGATAPGQLSAGGG
jgi:hypothetical protein